MCDLDDSVDYSGPRGHPLHLASQGYGNAHSHDPYEAGEDQVAQQ